MRSGFSLKCLWWLTFPGRVARFSHLREGGVTGSHLLLRLAGGSLLLFASSGGRTGFPQLPDLGAAEGVLAEVVEKSKSRKGLPQGGKKKANVSHSSPPSRSKAEFRGEALPRIRRAASGTFPPNP